MTDITEEIQALLEQAQSLILGTLTENPKQIVPDISYAPFLLYSEYFHIFVSKLSAHTQHMLNHQQISIMIIEDEGSAKNIFARRRISFQCQVKNISLDQKEFNHILDAMAVRHGKTINLLKQLPDFQLFQLSPVQGCYIKGFGQAFIFPDGKLNNATPVTQESLSNSG